MNWEPVIGLEVHVELYTKSKMFCTCSADYFGKEPNTHVCPVCLGLPGALPTPNKQAIDWCVEIGLALGCKISSSSKFDRKNYFYPDLAKGYQISQYDQPFCSKGEITITGGKKIMITRVHMEEDTGKLTHATVEGKNVSLIDFNRSGVPLVEIVTEPDFKNAQEVVDYLKKLQQTIRYLGVSSADMEKGDMRLEPNISLRKKGQRSLPNYKVEVKNINSFRFVEKAINFEIDRQSELLNSTKLPAQETRGWNEQKNATVSQRSKEEAHDYRYFPEPDIPPFEFKNDYIEKIRAAIGELPDTKLERFKRDFSLNNYDAEILTREIETADYFEEALKAGKEAELSPKQVANIIINKKPDILEILPATLIKNYITANQTAQINESQLEKAIDEAISENRKAVEDYKSGKQNVLMFLVGSVMRKIATKIDANLVRTKILEKIK